MSVTRKQNLSFQALKNIAQSIATGRNKTLFGWANIKASSIREQPLDVIAAPEMENPHHANIVGWPPDKPAQKMLAIELAKKATFEPTNK